MHGPRERAFGFSIIEVIVAFFLLATAFLTMLELIPTANKSLRQGRLYVMANHFARSQLELCLYDPISYGYAHATVYDCIPTPVPGYGIYCPDFSTNGVANNTNTADPTTQGAVNFIYDVYWTPLSIPGETAADISNNNYALEDVKVVVSWTDNNVTRSVTLQTKVSN